MHRDDVAALFDRHAPDYDTQWKRMSPVRDALYFLMEAALAPLPTNAHVLSVGAGTGAELAILAANFPQWQFTAVDPSRGMIDLCRQRAEAEGYASRCTFHHGFLESLETDTLFDGATCLLVSQFLVDPNARHALFRDIAARMRPGGVLINADLAAHTDQSSYHTLLSIWLGRMNRAGVPPEAVARAKAAYATDVAVLPPERVAQMIAESGFETPIPLFQAALMHAWCATRQGVV